MKMIALSLMALLLNGVWLFSSDRSLVTTDRSLVTTGPQSLSFYGGGSSSELEEARKKASEEHRISDARIPMLIDELKAAFKPGSDRDWFNGKSAGDVQGAVASLRGKAINKALFNKLISELTSLLVAQQQAMVMQAVGSVVDESTAREAVRSKIIASMESCRIALREKLTSLQAYASVMVPRYRGFSATYEEWQGNEGVFKDMHTLFARTDGDFGQLNEAIRVMMQTTGELLQAVFSAGVQVNARESSLTQDLSGIELLIEAVTREQGLAKLKEEDEQWLLAKQAHDKKIQEVNSLLEQATQNMANIEILLAKIETAVKSLKSEDAASVDRGDLKKQLQESQAAVLAAQTASVSLAVDSSSLDGLLGFVKKIRLDGNDGALKGQSAVIVDAVKHLDKTLPQDLTGIDESDPRIQAALQLAADREKLLNMVSAQKPRIEDCLAAVKQMGDVMVFPPLHTPDLPVSTKPADTSLANEFLSFLEELHYRTLRPVTVHRWMKGVVQDFADLRAGLRIDSVSDYAALAYISSGDQSLFAPVAAHGNFLALAKRELTDKEVVLIEKQGVDSKLIPASLKVLNRLNDFLNRILFRATKLDPFYALSDESSDVARRKALIATQFYREFYDAMIIPFEGLNDPSDFDPQLVTLLGFERTAASDAFESMKNLATAVDADTFTPITKKLNADKKILDGLLRTLTTIDDPADFQAVRQGLAEVVSRLDGGLIQEAQDGIVRVKRRIIEVADSALEKFIPTSLWAPMGAVLIEAFPGLRPPLSPKNIAVIRRFLLELIAIKKPPVIKPTRSEITASVGRVVTVLKELGGITFNSGWSRQKCVDVLQDYVMVRAVLHPQVIPSFDKFAKKGILSFIQDLGQGSFNRFLLKVACDSLGIDSASYDELAGVFQTLHDTISSNTGEDFVFSGSKASARDVLKFYTSKLSNIGALAEFGKELSTLTDTYAVVPDVATHATMILQRTELARKAASTTGVETIEEDKKTLSSMQGMLEPLMVLFASKMNGFDAKLIKEWEAALEQIWFDYLENIHGPALKTGTLPLAVFPSFPVPWVIGRSVAILTDWCLPQPITNVSTSDGAIKVGASFVSPKRITAEKPFQVALQKMVQMPVQLGELLVEGKGQILLEKGKQRVLKKDVNAILPDSDDARFIALYQQMNQELIKADFTRFAQLLGLLYYNHMPLLALRQEDLSFLLRGGHPDELIAVLESDRANGTLPSWVDYSPVLLDRTYASIIIMDVLGDDRNGSTAVDALEKDNLGGVANEYARNIFTVLWRNKEKKKDFIAALREILEKIKTLKKNMIPLERMVTDSTIQGSIAVLGPNMGRLYNQDNLDELETRTYAQILTAWIEANPLIDFRAIDPMVISDPLVMTTLVSLTAQPKWQEKLAQIAADIKANKTPSWDVLSTKLHDVYDLGSIEKLSIAQVSVVPLPGPATQPATLPVGVPIAGGAGSTVNFEKMIDYLASRGCFKASTDGRVDYATITDAEIEAAIGGGWKIPPAWNKGMGSWRKKIGQKLDDDPLDIAAFKKQAGTFFKEAIVVPTVPMGVPLPPPPPGILPPPPPPGPPGIGGMLPSTISTPGGKTHAKLTAIIKVLRDAGCLREESTRVPLSAVKDDAIEAATGGIPAKWKTGFGSWRNVFQKNLNATEEEITDAIIFGWGGSNEAFKLEALFADPVVATGGGTVIGQSSSVSAAVTLPSLGAMLKLTPHANVGVGEFDALVDEVVLFYKNGTTTPPVSPLMQKYAAIIKIAPELVRYGKEMYGPVAGAKPMTGESLRRIVQDQLLAAFLSDAKTTHDFSRLAAVLGDRIPLQPRVRYLRRPKCKVSIQYLNFLKAHKPLFSSLSSVAMAVKTLGTQKSYTTMLDIVKRVRDVNNLYQAHVAMIIDSIIEEIGLIIHEMSSGGKAVVQYSSFPSGVFDLQQVDESYKSKLVSVAAVLRDNHTDGLGQLKILLDSIPHVASTLHPSTIELVDHLSKLFESVTNLKNIRGLCMVVDNTLQRTISPYTEKIINTFVAEFMSVRKKKIGGVSAGNSSLIGGNSTSNTTTGSINVPSGSGSSVTLQGTSSVSLEATRIKQIEDLITSSDFATLQAYHASDGASILFDLLRNNVNRKVVGLINSVLDKGSADQPALNKLVTQVDSDGNTILMRLIAYERNLDLDEAALLCGRLIDISPGILVQGNTLGEAPLDIVIERFKGKNVDRFIAHAKRAVAAGVQLRESATLNSARRVRIANHNPLQLFLKSILGLPTGTRVQKNSEPEVKLATQNLGLCADKIFYEKMDTTLEERKYGMGGSSFQATILALSELSSASDVTDPCDVFIVGDKAEPMPVQEVMKSVLTVQDYLVFMLDLQRLAGRATNQYASVVIKKLIASGYLQSGVAGGAVFTKFAALGTDTEALWKSLFTGSAAEAQQRADALLLTKVKSMTRGDEVAFDAAIDLEPDLLKKAFGPDKETFFHVILDAINPDEEVRLLKFIDVLNKKGYDFSAQNGIRQNSVHKFALWSKRNRRYGAFSQALTGTFLPVLLRVPDSNGRQPLDVFDLSDIVGGGLMSVQPAKEAILERLGVGANLIASGAWF